MRPIVTLCCIAVCSVACGPTSTRELCIGEECSSGSCRAGEKRECYTGSKDSLGVGACATGKQTCTAGNHWGGCVGEVLPVAENCSDGLDNNCNGAADENEDRDLDGFTTCAGVAGGGDCCDSTECSDPGLVNPGAFDAPGNVIDDDCNGHVDDALAACDQSMQSNSSAATDYAKALDICQTASMTDNKWGVISAKLTWPDGNGVPDPNSYSIRNHFGSRVMPRGGSSMVLLSSGAAAGKGDTNPNYADFTSYEGNNSSGFPADFVAANGGKLPNAPGCPGPSGAKANDPVMLTLEIRVPSNAHSFTLNSNFFSAEFPEFTCSPYNDFFVVLLDSKYAGTPANPTDKNLAFYTQPGTNNKYPVGVNLAFGDTGLFTQCINGVTGCVGTAGTISTCVGTDDLQMTGFDDPSPFQCELNSLKGGATGWLTTSGNVVPGEIIKLRIAIWDTSDRQLDSLAVIDGFQWAVEASQPGTVILRELP